MIISVNSGDTLFSISRMYGIPISKIAADNGILNDSLVVGQSLIIDNPDDSIFTSNDTSASIISEKYSITLRNLFRNNYFLKGRENVPKNSLVVLSYMNTPSISKITGGYAYDFISAERLSSVINYLTYGGICHPVVKWKNQL